MFANQVTRPIEAAQPLTLIAATSTLESSLPTAVGTTTTSGTAPSRKRERRKIKRTAKSFRPGMKSSEQTSGQVEKLLIFEIPSASCIGNPDEFREVHELALSIDAKLREENLGHHDNFGLTPRAYELRFLLASPSISDLDELLSCAFLAVDDILSAKSYLRSGFANANVPTWEFKVGDTLADQGGFA